MVYHKDRYLLKSKLSIIHCSAYVQLSTTQIFLYSKKKQTKKAFKFVVIIISHNTFLTFLPLFITYTLVIRNMDFSSLRYKRKKTVSILCYAVIINKKFILCKRKCLSNKFVLRNFLSIFQISFKFCLQEADESCTLLLKNFLSYF